MVGVEAMVTHANGVAWQQVPEAAVGKMSNTVKHVKPCSSTHATFILFVKQVQVRIDCSTT